MDIVKQLAQGTCQVTLRGKFTFNDHTEFRDILNLMAQPDVDQVLLMMDEVEFVDSAALGMLLLAHDEAEKHKKQLIISGVTGQVKKMFDMARFNTIFTMA